MVTGMITATMKRTIKGRREEEEIYSYSLIL
jgi:hypothetical protein